MDFLFFMIFLITFSLAYFIVKIIACNTDNIYNMC